MATYTVTGNEKLLTITSSTGQVYKLNTDNVDTILSRGTEKASLAAALFYIENRRMPEPNDALPTWIKNAVNNTTITGGENWFNSIGNISVGTLMFGDIEGFKTKVGRERAEASINLMIADAPDLQQGISTSATQAANQTVDPYFRDIYSLEEGTGGRAMYDELAAGFERQAGLAGVAADVQFQQQALQQAQVVKQITDQVRAERMARLRAGMSESQIANQDMQQMMTNVNALNQNAAMLNQGRIESQLGQMGARDQAYLTYLEQSNQRGQVGAATSAAEAGNAYLQALRRMEQTGENFSTAYKNVVTPGGS
jgi:hypothetical protein